MRKKWKKLKKQGPHEIYWALTDATNRRGIADIVGVSAATFSLRKNVIMAMMRQLLSSTTAIAGTDKTDVDTRNT